MPHVCDQKSQSDSASNNDISDISLDNNIFISYSRKDKDFVQQLHQLLTKRGYRTWVDWEDIPLTADWLQEIYQGIESANHFIFVISPDSIASTVCKQELQHAVENNKHLIPIVYREILHSDAPPSLRMFNWLFWRTTDTTEGAVQGLISAIQTDLAHVSGHTWLLVRAIEWERKHRDSSFLLQGNALTEAQQLMEHGVSKTPKFTPLQVQYVTSSQLSVNQKQRTRTLSLGLGLIVALGLATTALWQSQIARQEQQDAATDEVQAFINSAENHLILQDDLNALVFATVAHQKLAQLSNVPESLKTS